MTPTYVLEQGFQAVTQGEEIVSGLLELRRQGWEFGKTKRGRIPKAEQKGGENESH